MSEREIAAEDSIKVVCRCRPLNSLEQKAGSKYIVKFPCDENSICIAGKIYSYDKVFQPSATQEKVYNEAARGIVLDVLAGYNGTIFAYGQTSSGKTHTMEGVIDDPIKQGIIPRIVNDIFNHIYGMEENLEFHIKVSYFEVYLDKIRDLLDISKVNLSVHEDKDRVPYVKGATERFVSSPEEVFEVIELGKSNRHISITNMNEYSSRSHSVFLINVKQENLENQKKLSGKLYLVDLAGSEKVSKSGAEGTVLDEAKNINKSLSALGNVISALADGNKTHIPYRDSKLTRILQESLGGNARTTIVICCSPASYNEAETKSTLEFGKRAKTVKNIVSVNEELTAEEWKRRYEQEKERTTRLKGKMEKLEIELTKWRVGETVNTEEQVNLTEIIEAVSPKQKDEQNASPIRLFTLSNEERSNFEQERERLYQELDEKDEEINLQSQTLETIKEQIMEQDEMIESTRRDYEKLQTEINKIQHENEGAKKEVQDLLQSLEEMAVSYDKKSQEVNFKNAELEAILADLKQKQLCLKTTSSELQQVRDHNVQQNRRISEMLGNLIKDLTQIDAVLGNDMDGKFPEIPTNCKIEEEITVARLYINKLKTEIKILAQNCQDLDLNRTETHKKIQTYETDLGDCRLLISQQEACIKNLQETVAEIENKKRVLEEEVDGLREECAKLKAAEQVNAATIKKKIETQQLMEALEEQMNQLRNAHQKQVATLRDEIAEKQQQINDLKDLNQKLTLALHQNQVNYDKLKQDETEKTEKLKEFITMKDKHDQSLKEIKTLENAVCKELQTLHELRKMFVQNLQQHFKKRPPAGEEISSDENGSIEQKQKISFLESNLDQLTSVHKQLVRDNAELRCQLPKLEKRFNVSLERVKQMEIALKTAKECAMKDRKRYQIEVDRFKAAIKQKNVRRGPCAQIAKPIRAGAGQQHFVPAEHLIPM